MLLSPEGGEHFTRFKRSTIKQYYIQNMNKPIQVYTQYIKII